MPAVSRITVEGRIEKRLDGTNGMNEFESECHEHTNKHHLSHLRREIKVTIGADEFNFYFVGIIV